MIFQKKESNEMPNVSAPTQLQNGWMDSMPADDTIDSLLVDRPHLKMK